MFTTVPSTLRTRPGTSTRIHPPHSSWVMFLKSTCDRSSELLLPEGSSPSSQQATQGPCQAGQLITFQPVFCSSHIQPSKIFSCLQKALYLPEHWRLDPSRLFCLEHLALLALLAWLTALPKRSSKPPSSFFLAAVLTPPALAGLSNKVMVIQ